MMKQFCFLLFSIVLKTHVLCITWQSQQNAGSKRPGSICHGIQQIGERKLRNSLDGHWTRILLFAGAVIVLLHTVVFH